MIIQLFKIVIPIAFQHLMLSLNSLLDTYMVGKLGNEALAAAGSANKFIGIAKITLLGILTGNSILTSQFHSKADNRGTSRAFVVNFVLSLTFSLGFAIFYFVNRKWIPITFSENPEIQRLAGIYLNVGVFSIIVLSILFPMIASLRSKGVVNFPFTLTTVMLATNFSLNYLLIFGKFGFPKMGMIGAAIATLVSEIFVVIVGYIASDLLGYKVISSFEYVKKIPFSFVKKYLTLAVPLTIANFLWGACLSKIHNIFGMMGTDALAAFSALSPVETSIQYLFGGFGSAVLIMVGTELGRNNFESAYKKAKDISLIGALIAGIIGSLGYISSGFIASFYNKISPMSHQYLTSMIGIFSIFLWVRVFNSISLNGTFRSGGDSVFIFWIVAITSWFMTLPSLYIGHTHLNWGPVEVYFVANFMEIVLALMFVIRFRSKKWMKNLSKREEE